MVTQRDDMRYPISLSKLVLDVGLEPVLQTPNASAPYVTCFPIWSLCLLCSSLVVSCLPHLIENSLKREIVIPFLTL